MNGVKQSDKCVVSPCLHFAGLVYQAVHGSGVIKYQSDDKLTMASYKQCCYSCARAQ